MIPEHAAFETLAVHAGQEPDEETGALVAPVFMTSTYVFTPEKMERYLSGDKEGIFTYGRSRNPTQNALQQKIAALEGAPASLAVASGMAAVSLAILNCVHHGDHVLSCHTVYGGTHALISKVLSEFGIDHSFVEEMTEEALNRAVKPRTKVLYFETVYNPTLAIPDIELLVRWAKAKGITTIIDNTFATPWLFRPLEHGVDVVIHSSTKYINGHGDLIGGVILGQADFIDKIRSGIYQELGPVPAPMNCYLTLRGLKTLHLRMRRHCENAMAFAEHFSAHPLVEKVIYPGLPDDPSHENAKKYFRPGFYGGMVCIVVKGGIKEAQRVINNLHIAHYCVSLGDLDTLVEQPATMTHGKIAPEERLRMGIPDSMIRVSLGVEEIGDIIADFEQALRRLEG